MVKADFYGTPLYFRMELNRQGDQLTGTFGGDKLEGTVNGNSIRFLAKDTEGGSEDGRGAWNGAAMSGTLVVVDSGDPVTSVHALVHG